MRSLCFIIGMSFSSSAFSIELGSWLIHEVLVREYLVVKEHAGELWPSHAEKAALTKQWTWSCQQSQYLGESVVGCEDLGNKLQSEYPLALKNYKDFYLEQRIRPLTLLSFQSLESDFVVAGGMNAPTAVQTIYALREKRYGSVLQTLVGLTEKHQNWKVIYNKVQRIYALQQKGAGRTALNW